MRAICCTFWGFMLPCLPILPICCMMPLPFPFPGPMIIVRILMYSPAVYIQSWSRPMIPTCIFPIGFAQTVQSTAVHAL